jgi:hypothetical protein
MSACGRLFSRLAFHIALLPAAGLYFQSLTQSIGLATLLLFSVRSFDAPIFFALSRERENYEIAKSIVGFDGNNVGVRRQIVGTASED